MAERTNWTSEQRSVIDSREQSLLVSAAAGSGKTAVLVQRILDQILDEEHPVDIDRMLIVTFTNAAAAQLREKIRGRLEEELEAAAKAEDINRLEAASRQLSLLSGDHIETIDRFCREVVLDHADAIGVDPSFRIGDEGELKLLQADAAALTIEEAYASEDTEFAEAFSEFSELYAPGRTDRQLEEMILRFWIFSQSHTFPRIWRHECAQQYRGDAAGSEWMQSMLDWVRMEAGDLHAQISSAAEVCRQSGGPYHYLDCMEDHEQILSALHHSSSLEQYRTILSELNWKTPGRRKKSGPEVDPAKETYAKDIRSKVKAELDKLSSRLFPFSEEETDEIRHRTARSMDVLVRITDAFEDLFSRMKRERNIADFSDVAHNALQILIRTDENGMPVTDGEGRYVPTPIAREYASWFEQICIDEYQDSNPVQELLLWSVSRQPLGVQNRFLVGDVKQSIYRFRMADPGIFNEKAQVWPAEENAPERRIDLHANFRSRACILDAVNLIFRQIMRREAGGIEYDEREMLRRGYPFPDDPDELIPELLLIEKDEYPEADSRAEAEAQAVAGRILQIAGRMQIYDKDTGEYRPVEYGDITILLRSAKNWAPVFSRVLQEHGIPNRSGARTGYFDAPQVRTILSYLHVLDNPRQDIPLAASLRSEIGHLTDRELSKIRSCSREGSLFDCVLHYAQCGEEEQIREKLRVFLDRTASLREDVKDTPIHILLWKIYDETGYADAVGASEGGLQKRANLDLLVDKAIAYEETSYRGLFHFIRYIEKLRKGDMDFAPAQGMAQSDNEVSILTMHAAKGLEFPVTFVSGLGKSFNTSDSSSALALHASLGAGLDYVDGDRRVSMPNRIRRVITEQIRMDTIGEELRILYVAMTRAEQKLILSGCVDSRAVFLRRACMQRSLKEEKLPATQILGAKCMLEWVAAGLMRHGTERAFFDDAQLGLPPVTENAVYSLEGRMRILTGEDLTAASAAETLAAAIRIPDLADIRADEVYDAPLHSHLQKMLSFTYGHDRAAPMPGKLSVSELKHTAYEAEMERLEQEQGRRLFPEHGGTKGVSGADAGTAYHEVMAAADFDAEPYPGQIRAQLESMIKCDKIQREMALCVQPEKIERFLGTELAERMRRAHRNKKLRREQPFVIGVPGDEVFEEWDAGETVLIQGIIDAFFEEEDHIVLIDYKTDQARPGDEPSLVNRYRKQFELYRDALEKLLQKRVTEAWLYSFSLDRAVPVGLQPRD